MKNFSVLTPNSVNVATKEQLETINNQQLELVKLFNININAKALVEFANGHKHCGILKDFINDLPKHSNYDIVKFSNGNYGFVSDDHVHSIEIVRMMDENYFNSLNLNKFRNDLSCEISDNILFEFCNNYNITEYAKISQETLDNLDKSVDDLFNVIKQAMKELYLQR